MFMKSPAIRRFFFLFASFTVCLLAIIIPSYFVVYHRFAENTIQISNDALTAGLSTMESDIFNSYSAVVELLESDTNFTRISGNEKPDTSAYYSIYSAAQAFRRTMSYRASANDCALILPNGLILTKNRIFFSGDEMIPAFLQLDHYDTYEAFYDALSDTSSRQINILPMQTICSYDDPPYEGLTLVFRLTSNDSSLSIRARRMLFYLFLSDQYLLDQLMLGNVLEQSVLRLYTIDGQLLYCRPSKEKLRIYDTISATSSKLGMRVEIDINRALFDQELAGLRRILYITFAAFVLASILLALFYARQSARPVLRLSNHAARAYGTSSEPMTSCRDEYSYIAGFINHADRTIQNYQSAIDQQNGLLRSMLLRQLVSNPVVSKTAVLRVRQYFPDFPDHYVVVLIRAQSIMIDENNLLDERAMHQLRVLPVLENYLPAHALIYPISYSGSIIAIIPQPDETAAQALPSIVRKSHAELESCTGAPVEIVVSLPCDCIEAMPRAYAQVQMAERLYHEPETPIIYCKPEMMTEAQPDGVLFQDLDRFYDALMHGNSSNAVALLQAAHCTLRTMQGVSEQTIIRTFYAYVCQMLRARSDMAFAGMNSIEPPSYDAQLSLESLFLSLENCALKMCSQLLTYREQSASARDQEVFDHITAQFGDPMLCIQSVTDRFGITEYALQRIVRNATGKSFFEYLDSLRMNHARLLLLETEMPLAAIIEKCGYNSRNTFYKAFKRTFGMAPSELREKKKD